MQKGIRYRLQNRKKIWEKKCCTGSNTFLQHAKGLLLPFEQLQKVKKHPLEQIACGIHELHASPTMLAIYNWENLISSLKIEASF
jgi:hypothetical protein